MDNFQNNAICVFYTEEMNWTLHLKNKQILKETDFLLKGRLTESFRPKKVYTAYK